MNSLQNATTSFSRPSAIDYSTIENSHQILSNSVSNSSTNSNTSAFSISSNLSENVCPTLPKSFIDNSNKSFNDSHQCLKPGLIKHPLMYQHTSNNQSHQSNSPHTHSSPHSPLSPLAHFSHQHLHHLHHQNNNRSRTDSMNSSNLQFKPLCRTQNINNFAKLADALHRKIEYTGSSGSAGSNSTSGCVSASSSSHNFPLSNSSICSSSSGPQTPQSGYVQSPLAQSFTTDSGLCLSYRSSNNGQQSNNTTSNQIISHNSLNSNADLSTELLLNKCEKLDKIENRLIVDRASRFEATNEADSKVINKNTIKKLDFSSNKRQSNFKVTEQKSFLNLPASKTKDTDNESLLSDYLKEPYSTASTNGLSATSSTNLVSNNLHSTITAKPSLSGASSSFFHYPNIYNPLKNPRNQTKNNKKLIRFVTVCAYVLCVSLVAILLSLYYLFLWSPYKSSNGNYTRTFINSEILFIEKTNYYDVDLTAHPHVIGQQPNAIHLTPTKVNLNQTESKIILPLAADESISIERFGFTSLNGGGTVIGNSEESDGSNGSANNIAVTSLNGVSANRQTYETRHLVQTRTSLPITLALKRSMDKSGTIYRNSMDSDQQTDYSGENNYQPKLINLLKKSNKSRYLYKG